MPWFGFSQLHQPLLRPARRGNDTGHPQMHDHLAVMIVGMGQCIEYQCSAACFRERGVIAGILSCVGDMSPANFLHHRRVEIDIRTRANDSWLVILNVWCRGDETRRRDEYTCA